MSIKAKNPLLKNEEEVPYGFLEQNVQEKADIDLISHIGQTLQLASCSLAVPLTSLSQNSTLSFQATKNPFSNSSTPALTARVHQISSLTIGGDHPNSSWRAPNPSSRPMEFPFQCPDFYKEMTIGSDGAFCSIVDIQAAHENVVSYEETVRNRAELIPIDDTRVSRAALAVGAKVVEFVGGVIIDSFCRLPVAEAVCPLVGEGMKMAGDKIAASIPDSFKKNHEATLIHLEKYHNIPVDESRAAAKNMFFLGETIALGFGTGVAVKTLRHFKTKAPVIKAPVTLQDYTPFRSQGIQFGDAPYKGFARDIAGFDDVEMLRITPVNKGFGRDIYKVFDLDGDTLFMVKDLQMTHPMAQEIRGYEILHSLKLTKARIPTVLGTATYQTATGATRSLMAMKCIEGENVAHLIANVAKHPNTFGLSLEAVERVGYSLGELHFKSRVPGLLPSNKVISQFIQDGRSFVNHLSESLSMKKGLFKEAAEGLTRNPGETAIVDPDRWVGNWIHKPRQQIGIIDPSDLADFIKEPSGQPTGIPAIDYHTFRSSLESLARQHGLSDSMIKEWVTTFERAYKKTNPRPFTPEADHFSRLYTEFLTLDGRWFEPTPENLTRQIAQFNKEFK